MCISLIFCLRWGNFFTAFVVFLCSLASSLRVVHMMCCRARIWLSMHVVILQQSTHISKGFKPVGCLLTPCLSPFHSDSRKVSSSTPTSPVTMVWTHISAASFLWFTPFTYLADLHTRETNFQLVKTKASVETVISAFEPQTVTCKAKAARKEKKDTKRSCLCAATLNRAHVLLTDSTSLTFFPKTVEKANLLCSIL